MAKKTKAGKWIQRLRVGSATIAVRGNTKKEAIANGLRFAERHLKNVRGNNFGRFVYVLRGSKSGALPGEYSGRLRAIIEAVKASKRLGEKVTIRKQRPNFK